MTKVRHQVHLEDTRHGFRLQHDSNSFQWLNLKQFGTFMHEKTKLI